MQAQPHLRSLWADVMELEGATDEPTLLLAREQTLHRVVALGRAARAAHAHGVAALSQALASLVTAVGHAPDTTREEAFAGLRQKMTEITGALYGIHRDAATGPHAEEPTEGMELVGCGAN